MVARSSAQRSVTKVSLVECLRISSPGAIAIPLVTPPRPVDHASAVQSPPDQHRLQRQPRPVIEPAVGDGWKVDALQGMLDVGRPHARRIERELAFCRSQELSAELARAASRRYRATPHPPARSN